MTVTAWPIDWPADVTFEDDPRHKLLAEAYAIGTLRFLTLQRVGGEAITVSPAAPTCQRRSADLYGMLPDEHFRGCWCRSGCGCDASPYVLLDGPVGRIDEVRVNGEVLPATAYHVENGNRLVRTDGGRWPSCIGWDFTVTYLQGYPVDIIGAHVGGILALEYLKAIRGERGCRLPDGIKTITRAGIAMEFNTEMFAGGVTGIPEVDAWVRQWNPFGMVTRPRVYSVDDPQVRRLPMGFRGMR